MNLSLRDREAAKRTLMAILAQGMRDPETHAVRLLYRDSHGVATLRTVSPIRFKADDAFLALCLGREEPRTFLIGRCLNARLVPSWQCLSPMPIQTCTPEPPAAGENQQQEESKRGEEEIS